MNVNGQEIDEEVIDLSELFYQCYRNLGKIILITVIGAMLGFFYSAFFIQPTYSASADIIISSQQSMQESTTTYSDIQVSTSLASTYSTILKSHTVLEGVITNLSLEDTYEELKEKVTIESVDSTQVLRISVVDASADTALSITREIVNSAPNALVSQGSVVTVDEPWTTGEKVGPNKTKNALIGGAIGFVISIGMIFISIFTNNTIQTEKELEDLLGINVLAVTPKAEIGAKSKNKKKKKK